MTDERLEAALRSIGPDLAAPAPSPSFALAVRSRVEAQPRSGRGWPMAGFRRPVSRSLLAAVVLLLVLAAVAAAVGLGVPGIRILFGNPGTQPTTTATPSLPGESAPPGAGLGLGTSLPLDEVPQLLGFGPRLPSDLDPPDAAFVGGRRLTLVWTADTMLPPLRTAPSLGLVLTEFRGLVDEGWYEKVLVEGRSTVDAVEVRGGDGYWITGDPHPLVYRAPDGTFSEETRRIVGDVLIWRDGDLTFRLESSLGQAATIRLAESME